MYFQQSCASVSSEIVEILSDYVCTDIAKYIMEYVNLEKSAVEHIHRIITTAVGLTVDDWPADHFQSMWNLTHSCDADIAFNMMPNHLPTLYLRRRVALDFANRFKLSGSGEVVVRLGSGASEKLKW
jgi:hypothetical protein